MFATRVSAPAGKTVSGTSKAYPTEPKPVIGEVNDPLEHEAIALPSKSCECPVERADTVTRQLLPATGGGRPLDTATLAFRSGPGYSQEVSLEGNVEWHGAETSLQNRRWQALHRVCSGSEHHLPLARPTSAE
jgi:hypothetical protein